MEPQLENIPDPVAGFWFQFLKGRCIPGIEDQWFFTNHLCAIPESEAHVGVVEVIGRTNDDIINLFTGAFLFFQMAVKPFKFGKKGCIGKITIQHSNSVIGIKRGNEVVAGFFNRFQVSWCDVPCSADEGEVFDYFLNIGFNSIENPSKTTLFKVSSSVNGRPETKTPVF